MFSFQNSQSGALDETVDPLLPRLRAKLPRPLVFTNGVFDILHAGHVACLAEARRHGRSLVVGINTDASARRLAKGPGRPLNNAVDRARVIGALASVTTVVLYDEDKPLALMRALQPDVYVKGGDCEAEHLEETGLLATWGGHTVIVPRLSNLSTSILVERIWAAQAFSGDALAAEPSRSASHR